MYKREKLKQGMSFEEQQTLDKIMNAFREVSHTALVQTITELQILEADLADKEFVLQGPASYTNAQNRFLKFYVMAFVEALREMKVEVNK